MTRSCCCTPLANLTLPSDASTWSRNSLSRTLHETLAQEITIANKYGLENIQLLFPVSKFVFHKSVALSKVYSLRLLTSNEQIILVAFPKETENRTQESNKQNNDSKVISKNIIKRFLKRRLFSSKVAWDKEFEKKKKKNLKANKNEMQGVRFYRNCGTASVGFMR